MQTAVASIPAPRLGRWANANELPVIDFAPLSGTNEAAIERVAKEVHDACRDIGFLTIVNHPVPPAKIREIFRQSQRFFALPVAEKMKAYMGHSNLFRGYLPMDEPGKQKAYRGKAIEGFQPHLDPARMKARKPHKNEAFQASLELPANDPSPEQRLFAEQQLDRLMEGIKRLPAKCQQVFILSRFHDMGYPEIAARCADSTLTISRAITTQHETRTTNVFIAPPDA